MTTYQDFLNGISEIKPVVDNPAGLMHNYMARKPFNVVAEIISGLTEPGQVVYDPMAGSGTTIIESSKLGRTGIGADVNPVACSIMRNSLRQWDQEQVRHDISNFLARLDDVGREVYSVDVDGADAIIERCHFCWNGKSLIPNEFWYKEIKSNGSYGPRKKSFANDSLAEGLQRYATYATARIPNTKLIPNSRIAIPEGRSVFDYFCPRNLYFLDQCINVLDDFRGRYSYDLLEMLVSSSINLIKLSDKKASSQIPFWIPKKSVTSRNGYLVLLKKAKAVLNGVSYLEQEKRNSLVESFDEASNGRGCIVFEGGSQSIPEPILPNGSVDLVLTDPPYTDQVPYVEYAQLDASILGWDLTRALSEELVVSDAPARAKNQSDFENTFRQILDRTTRALKPNGHFGMFYHSFDIQSWDVILRTMSSYGLQCVGQVPMRTPRKSFKTVMSPGRTLDGNYFILFKKSQYSSNVCEWTYEDALKRMRVVVSELKSDHPSDSPQYFYDQGLLKDAIDNDYLRVIAQSAKTFSELPIFEG